MQTEGGHIPVRCIILLDSSVYGGRTASIARESALLAKASANMNKLYIGQNNDIELPSGGFLYIDDTAPRDPLIKVFDPTVHSFNPVQNIEDIRADMLADALYTVFPQGGNTLTVRNGRWDLAPAFLTTTRLDHFKSESEEATNIIKAILFFKTVRHALTGTKHIFPFKKEARICALLDRAKIGEKPALIIAFMLMSFYKGQIIIPDGGFYLRDAHSNLVREERLIAGVRYLSELPLQLRKSVLLIKDKIPSHVLYEDAVTLAELAGYVRDTMGYSDSIAAAMGSGL